MFFEFLWVSTGGMSVSVKLPEISTGVRESL